MIDTKNFDGDVSVGRNAAIGGDAKIVGGVTVGRNLKVEGWLDAKNIKGANKGVFLNEESLKKAYPIPQDGWWALVGETMPAALWVAWGGEWANTGGTGGEITVEIQQIAETIERLEEEMQGIRNVNELQTNNIVALQSSDISLDGKISALEAKDIEHNEAIVAIQGKDATQDGKISSLEAKDATHDTKIEKLEERVMQYLYPKIYQLNEGAGARVFHGFYKGSASVSDERKTSSEEGYSYKVVFKSGSFYLQEISPEGVTVLYSSWAKISLPNNESIASSESYALRDCLYYIYVEGEGSTYYYIDSDGAASEQSATYLLRLLADKNAAAIAALQGKDAEQDGEIATLHERDTALDGKISALEAKDIDHNAAIVRNATVEYYDHSVTDGPSRINTRATFKFFGADNNQLFVATLLGAGNGYPGLLSLKNKTKLDGYADTFPQNPVASSESNGLMSAEDKRKLDSVGGVIDLPWDDDVQGQDGYINNFTERGEYHIHGKRLYDNDGLPIINSGDEHTIDGLMTVLDSSLPNVNKYDVCVTQILRLNNRKGGDGHIYVRTGIAATKSELKRPTAGGWSPWEKLMGVFEKNAVSNATDLNEYTSSGMYDGMFVYSPESQTTVSGLKIENGSTFLMVAVNGYAVAQTGVVQQVTQLLYVMPSGLDGSSGVRNAKLYTRTGICVASTKTYTWGKFDGLAYASDISKLDSDIQEIYGLIQENQSDISANTKEIANVNSTATRAQETADRAQEAADKAQTAATKEKERNDKQDERLEKIENSVSHLSAAGRYWNEANGTPTAAGHYGSLDALRSLPEKLGLGRYLVKDDRTRRKLDPKDSTKYADDGTDAKLDGTDGQCMWCWNGFYANVWKDGDNLFKVVSFERPVGNDISIWIPAGGISWLGAGVIDRGEAPYTDKTKWKLCSVINNYEQFRGGGGSALNPDNYSKAPAAESPQISMLGMPATYISTTDFGTYARKRGEGWEANWFVARFVVEFLFEIIMGTENSQEAFNANKGANGLYQGGFGYGVTGILTNWDNYNGSYPLIPTSVGLEAGDGVCLVEYKLPQTNGVDGDAYYTFQVPVFFGLVGAAFGNLWQTVRGLIVDVGSDKSLVYVANSIYAEYNPNTVDDKIMVEECTREYGYISRKSYRGLCCIATEVNGSSNTRYADQFQTNIRESARRIRFAGGSAYYSNHAGASQSYVYYVDTTAGKDITAPLCYFTEDPIIPSSQSIANNN